MTLSSLKLLKLSVLITIILVLIHVLLQFFLSDGTVSPHVVRIFNLNYEISIPTWYSTILHFLIAVSAFILGKIDSKKRVYWYGLSAIFLFTSLDEGSMIHETFDEFARNLIGITGGYLFFAWVIPVALMLVILGLIYIKFYLSLPVNTKIYMLASAMLFIFGALVMESIGANYITTDPTGDLHLTTPYIIFTTIEELCEMLGLSLFLYTLSNYAQKSEFKIPAVKIGT